MATAPVVKKDVGVLFVHGIGEQPRGDTLLRFGQPLVEWLQGWTARTGRAPNPRVRIARSALNGHQLADHEPAHAAIDLDPKPGAPAGASARSWLLAESWWADEFQKPAFGDLLAWMLTTGSWLILTHGGKPARGGKKRTAWVLVKLALFWFPITLAVQLALVLLGLLAMLPVPQLRDFLSGLTLKLSGSIGDSYVLTNSPLQRAAAVFRVRRDLDWLAERADRIVVVAHSQGAAIAHEALRGASTPAVAKLVTVGAGIGKLAELDLIRREQPLLFFLSRFIVPVCVLGACAFLALTGKVLSVDPGQLAPLAVAVIMVPISTAMTGMRAYLRRARRLSLLGVRPTMRWFDCYATHDPVSNGALVPRDRMIAGLRSMKVWNVASALHDHTTYWDNRTQFIPWLLREIDALCPSGWFERSDLRKLVDARQGRRTRVKTLWGLRLGILGLWMAFVCAAPTRDIGEASYRGIHSVSALQPVAGALRGAKSAVRRIQELIKPAPSAGVGSARDRTVRDTGFLLIGALLAFLVSVLLTRMTTWFWWAWDDRATRKLFDPPKEEPFKSEITRVY